MEDNPNNQLLDQLPTQDEIIQINNNNGQTPSAYIPPPINEPSAEDLIGKTVSSTVPISEAPESKEQSQMRQSNQSSMNNQTITNNNTDLNYLNYIFHKDY